MSRTKRSALDDFQDFVGDFHSVSALSAKAAPLLPLGDLVARVGPPWPPALAFMTSVAQLVVLVLLFQFWHRIGEKRMRRGMIIATAVLVASFFGYLVLFNVLLVDDIPGGQRAVAGFIVRPEVEPVLGEGFTARDALEEAEYDPAMIWTRASIAAARTALVAAWLTLFSALTVLLGTFVLYQRRQEPRHGSAD